MDIRFRPAAGGDAEAIASLHADSWRRTYRGMMPDRFLDGGALNDRRRIWRERLRTAPLDRHIVVADAGARIVGFVCAFASHDRAWGSLIDNLHVATETQGRGIGTALLADAARWLGIAAPDAGVYLWVMQANASARRFYERLGAAHAETTVIADPGGGQAPNCRYVWPTPGALLERTRASRTGPEASSDQTPRAPQP